MNIAFRYPEQTALAELAETMLQIGDSPETVMATLREGGLSKIDCMRVMADLLEIPLLQAKTLVLNSPAWR